MVLEPISIAVTAATLVGTCAKCTAYIWNLTNQVQTVDDAITTLGVEITSLSQVLENIRVSFNDPHIKEKALALQTGHELEHWKSVERSMKDCRETLEKMQTLFEGVSRTRTRFGIALTSKKMIKLNMKGLDIQLLKQQIAAYRRTMQLSFQLITV